VEVGKGLECSLIKLRGALFSYKSSFAKLRVSFNDAGSLKQFN
jgi:hypothetical protein